MAVATLGRQFPPAAPAGAAGAEAVVELVRRVGPVQSQAARAPFVSITARLPGASYDDVVEAHESLRLVRSTSLRGTVHTSTREQHADLAAVAIRALAPEIRRLLHLDDEQLAGFRAELERLSSEDWTSHGALVEGVVGWLTAHGNEASVHGLDQPGGLSLLRGHPRLLRRPGRPGARWDSQSEVVYWSASTAIGEQPVDPQTALVALIRGQLAAAGPASRRDLAWWSGAGLRQVDAVLESLAAELVARPGPNGLVYVDLADAPGGPTVPEGVRLLPEYDTLLLAYDPAARDRFADAAAVAHSWNKRNGVHSPTLLVDGRLRGRWRLERSRTSAAVQVEMFPGERLLDPSELADGVVALEKGLGVTVSDVRIRSI